MTIDTAAKSDVIRGRTLGPLGALVNRRISALQAAHLSGSPAARATLAALRGAVGRPVEASPEVWSTTLAAVPTELQWDRDEPCYAERAAHAAMTLYGLHQQSMSTRAHQRGISVGDAARRLAASDATSRQAVERRFTAALAARSATEITVHLQQLVTQFRSHGIGLDYAELADRLLTLLHNPSDTRVRLAWGRDFHRRVTSASGDPSTNTEIEES